MAPVSSPQNARMPVTPGISGAATTANVVTLDREAFLAAI
jgi:hypothetical protein